MATWITSPPILSGTEVIDKIDETSPFTGGYVLTKDQILNDQYEETKSIWTVRETSFSGADIKAYLMIYGGNGKEMLERYYEAQIDFYTILLNHEKILGYNTKTGENIYKAILSLQEELGKLQKAKGIEETAFMYLGDLQTISISTHRDKYPVRALGRASPKGYVRGQRTIAGSMIFTLFNHHPLAAALYGDMFYWEGYADGQTQYELPDQLPPLDIMLLGVNEYGYKMRTLLMGVEFVNEGMTFSIEDLFTESQLQYIARDWDPPREFTEGSATDFLEILHKKPWSISGTDLLQDEDFERYKRRNDPFM